MEDSEEHPEVRISFCIQHELEPSAISEILELAPSTFHKKDDVIASAGNRSLTADKTFWSLDSTDSVKGDVFEEHLNWILSQLWGRLPALRKLQNLGAETYIMAHIQPWNGLAAAGLDLDALRLLARLRVNLHFAFVYQTSDDEE
jgi:hypothetical protein